MFVTVEGGEISGRTRFKIPKDKALLNYGNIIFADQIINEGLISNVGELIYSRPNRIGKLDSFDNKGEIINKGIIQTEYTFNNYEKLKNDGKLGSMNVHKQIMDSLKIISSETKMNL